MTRVKLVNAIQSILKLYALKVLLIRGATLILSMCLLLSVNFFLDGEQADNVFLSLSYTQSLVTLYVFGYDKAIWRSSIENRASLYNSWFSFAILLMVVLLLIGFFIDRVPETILAFLIAVLFLRSWEDQAENRLLRSTIVFTGLIPTLFLILVMGFYFINLPYNVVFLLVGLTLLVVLYFSKLFEGFMLDFEGIFSSLSNNLYYVFPTFLISISSYLLLEHYSEIKEGLVYQYSGIIRLLAGIRVFTFVFNRLTINKEANALIRRYFVLIIITISAFYVLFLVQMQDFILDILGLSVHDPRLLLIGCGLVIVEYLGTQETFKIIASGKLLYLSLGAVGFVVMVSLMVLVKEESINGIFLVLIGGQAVNVLIMSIQRLKVWLYT